MTETYTMLVEIKARVDQAIRNLTSLEKTVEKAASKFDIMRTAVGQAAGMLINQFARAAAASIKETISLGADIQTLRNSFEAMATAAGRADLSLELLREATRGAVSDVDLLTSANKFMALNLPVDQMETLMGSAIQLGRAMGLNAAQSVNDLSVALGRNSPLVLDNFGVSLKLMQAQELLADRLGKTVDGLTDVEKASAFQIIAIEKIQEKAATLAGTTSEATLAQDRFAASIINLKSSIGEALAPLSSMAPAFTAMLPAIGQISITALPKLGQAITGAGGVVPALGSLVTAMTGPIGMAVLAVAAIGTIISALKKWKNENDAVIIAQRAVERAMDKVSIASQATTSAAEAYAAALGLEEAASDSVTTSLEARKVAADALAEAEGVLTEAQQALTASENTLATAQSNLASALSFVTGEVDTLTVSTEDMIFSSLQAEQSYGSLSAELLGLQDAYSLASGELESFNGMMDDNSDAMRGNRLEISRIRDAIEDRKDATAESILALQEEKEMLEAHVARGGQLTVTRGRTRIDEIKDELAALQAQGKATKEEEAQLRKLRAANRDLSISNQELVDSADDLKESLDDQAKIIDSATQSIDLLTAADQAVLTALEDVATKSDAVAEAQEKITENTTALREASDQLADSLTTRIEKQLEVATAHEASSKAAREEERALWSLLAAQDTVEAKRRKQEADEVLRLMGMTPSFGVPGMAEGGIVRKPTLVMVGERGPEAVIPLTGGGLPGIGGPMVVRIDSLISADTIILDPENLDAITNEIMLKFSDLLHMKGIRTVNI